MTLEPDVVAIGGVGKGDSVRAQVFPRCDGMGGGIKLSDEIPVKGEFAEVEHKFYTDQGLQKLWMLQGRALMARGVVAGRSPARKAKTHRYQRDMILAVELCGREAKPRAKPLAAAIAPRYAALVAAAPGA